MAETRKGVPKLQQIEENLFAAFLILFVMTCFNRELLIFGLDARLLPVLIGGVTLVVSLCNYFAAGAPDYRLRMRGGNRWLLAYFLLALICNVAWFDSPHVLVVSVFKTVFLANALNLFFLMVILINRRHLTWRLVAFAVLASGAALLGSMLFVFAGGDLRAVFSAYEGRDTDGISRTIFSEYRYSGYAQDPNFASLFMAIWGATAVYEWRRTKNPWYLSVLPLAVFGYLIAFSKSILVMLGLALIMAIASKYIVGAIAKEALVLGAIAGPLFVGTLGSHFPQLPTMTTRYQMWSNALALFPDRPVFGNGLTAARTGGLSLNWYVQNHNSVTQTVVELGIVGLVLLYLAVRKAVMSGHPLAVFVAVVFIGPFLTYEAMSHTFSILVLAVFPLALRQRPAEGQPRKSVYVINGLHHGGAERVVRNMVGASDGEDQVTIYTWGDEAGVQEQLPERATVQSLGSGRSYMRLPLYVWRLNFYLERDWAGSQIVLATSHLPFAQIATRLSRFDDEFLYVMHGMYGVRHSGLPARLTRWIYDSRMLVAVSEQLLQEEMLGNYGVRSKFATHIYNPLDLRSIDQSLAPYANEQKEKVVVNVGRYADQKNQMAAIAAFDESKLADDGYTMRLYGEGPRRDDLQRDIDRRGLTSVVTLEGFTDNPFREISRASAVLHSAEYEAFPMVMIETHYCGTPMVAFDVPFGARETMPGELRSYLAPLNDTTEMAKILRRAINEPYPHNDGLSVVEKVRPEVVMGEYYTTYRTWAQGPDASSPDATFNRCT